MEYQNMSIRLNKGKSIGKVLYIVEGGRTEPYILHRIFANIFDYQVETILRDKPYRKYNSKDNPTSQVFVINAEESSIKNIDRNNEFLDNLFKELIENYDFDVDNAAIYYLFDRDSRSNTDVTFIEGLLSVLVNSRDNDGFDRQGILLLSYPSIESFTLSNFAENSFSKEFEKGVTLKHYLHSKSINPQNLSEDTLVHAVKELLAAFHEIGVNEFDVDEFGECNKAVFDYEENKHNQEDVYRALSLVCISLIDLGLLELEDLQSAKFNKIDDEGVSV